MACFPEKQTFLKINEVCNGVQLDTALHKNVPLLIYLQILFQNFNANYCKVGYI